MGRSMKFDLIEAIRAECSTIKASVSETLSEDQLVGLLGSLNALKESIAKSTEISKRGPETGFLPDYYFKMSMLCVNERKMIEDYVRSTGIASSREMTEKIYMCACSIMTHNDLAHLVSTDLITPAAPEHRSLHQPNGMQKSGTTELGMPQRTLVRYDTVPSFLKTIPKWIVWGYFVTVEKETKVRTFVKKCFNPLTGDIANQADIENGFSFDAVCTAYQLFQTKVSGIGFILSGDTRYNDNVCMINVRNCVGVQRVPQAMVPFRELSDLALKVATSFADTYLELSPSGRGITVLFRGKLSTATATRTLVCEYEFEGQEVVLADGQYMMVPITGNLFNIDKQPLCPNPYGRLWLEELCGRDCVAISPEKPNYNLPPAKLVVSNKLPKLEEKLDPAPEYGDYEVQQTELMPDADLVRLAFAAKNGDVFRECWENKDGLTGKAGYGMIMRLARGLLNVYQYTRDCGNPPQDLLDAQIGRVFGTSKREGPGWWDKLRKDGKTNGQSLLEFMRKTDANRK